MNFVKHNFKNYERVKFFNTSDNILDSLTGIILGKNTDLGPYPDFYIVLFDGTTEYYGQRATSMTEACLERTGETVQGVTVNEVPS